MKLHPLCEMFPELPPLEKQQLRDSIEAIGQTHPIIVYEGMVLDGRHRLEVCQELGREPIIEIYDGDDPVAFVEAANFLRRKNYGPGQRAAFTIKAMAWREGELETRMNSHATVAQTLPLTPPVRKALAAKALCSVRFMEYAERLQVEDHKGLLDDVMQGKIALAKAYKLAFPPMEKPPAPAEEADIDGPDPEEAEIEALRAENEALVARTEELEAELERQRVEAQTRITELQLRLRAVSGLDADAAGERLMTQLQEELDNARRDINDRQRKNNDLVEQIEILNRKVPRDKKVTLARDEKGMAVVAKKTNGRVAHA